MTVNEYEWPNGIEDSAGAPSLSADLMLLYSIAISAKRIADKLDGDLLTQPVNAYGESFTDAIQMSIIRGQRGIETP